MELFLGNNVIVMALILLWVLPWKIYAVWTSVKRGDKKWFVALLVLNTLAILDIYYIFFRVKKTWKEVRGDFDRTISGK